MKSLAIVFLLLAVPAAIQCKPAIVERDTNSNSQLIALIQSILSGLTGPGGALQGQGITTYLQQLLYSSIGPNGTITSQMGNPNLGGVDLTATLQKLLNPLLVQGGVVQQLLTALGGNPNSAKSLVNFLFGPNGALYALLGPNGVLGQLISGKPLNLEATVQNLLTTLLAPGGVVPGLLDQLIGPGGVLNSGAVGNLLKPLIGTGGVVTNLVNSLVGLNGSDTLGSVKQLLTWLQQVLTGQNPPPLKGGILSTLLNGLVGSQGLVTKLLQSLGLVAGGTSGGGTSGGGLGGLLEGLLGGGSSGGTGGGLLSGVGNLLSGLLGGKSSGGTSGGGTSGGGKGLLGGLLGILTGGGSSGGGSSGSGSSGGLLSIIFNLLKGLTSG